MGFKFLLDKSEHEKLCRQRKLLEKFGGNPGLEAMLTPKGVAVQFRCETPDTSSVRAGDQVLIFTTGEEVQILKQNVMVARMTGPAAEDFKQNFLAKDCPEFQLGEVTSEACPLDNSFDIELRPPWKKDNPKSKKK